MQRCHVKSTQSIPQYSGQSFVGKLKLTVQNNYNEQNKYIYYQINDHLNKRNNDVLTLLYPYHNTVIKIYREN